MGDREEKKTRYLGSYEGLLRGRGREIQNGIHNGFKFTEHLASLRRLIANIIFPCWSPLNIYPTGPPYIPYTSMNDFVWVFICIVLLLYYFEICMGIIVDFFLAEGDSYQAGGSLTKLIPVAKKIAFLQ